MNEINWNPKCVICGKFVSYGADYSVSFGGAGDSEPPDPEYYCPKCIEQQKEFYRKQGRVPCSYISSQWEVDLATELGYVREQYRWVKKEVNNEPT